MTPEDKLAARRARWDKIQRDGIWRFVLREGVLKWGLGTAVLWVVAMSVVTSGNVDYMLMVPLSLVAFPIGGFFFGVAMWYMLQGLSRLATKLARRKQ
jgi:hypothetical protein